MVIVQIVIEAFRHHLIDVVVVVDWLHTDHVLDVVLKVVQRLVIEVVFIRCIVVHVIDKDAVIVVSVILIVYLLDVVKSVVIEDWIYVSCQVSVVNLTDFISSINIIVYKPVVVVKLVIVVEVSHINVVVVDWMDVVLHVQIILGVVQVNISGFVDGNHIIIVVSIVGGNVHISDLIFVVIIVSRQFLKPVLAFLFRVE